MKIRIYCKMAIIGLGMKKRRDYQPIQFNICDYCYHFQDYLESAKT